VRGVGLPIAPTREAAKRGPGRSRGNPDMPMNSGQGPYSQANGDPDAAMRCETVRANGLAFHPPRWLD